MLGLQLNNYTIDISSGVSFTMDNSFFFTGIISGGGIFHIIDKAKLEDTNFTASNLYLSSFCFFFFLKILS